MQVRLCAITKTVQDKGGDNFDSLYKLELTKLQRGIRK
jgi:hypothetical protein